MLWWKLKRSETDIREKDKALCALIILWPKGQTDIATPWAPERAKILKLLTIFSLDHDKAVVQNEFKYKNCCIDGQGKLLN